MFNHCKIIIVEQIRFKIASRETDGYTAISRLFDTRFSCQAEFLRRLVENLIAFGINFRLRSNSTPTKWKSETANFLAMISKVRQTARMTLY